MQRYPPIFVDSAPLRVDKRAGRKNHLRPIVSKTPDKNAPDPLHAARTLGAQAAVDIVHNPNPHSCGSCGQGRIGGSKGSKM